MDYVRLLCTCLFLCFLSISSWAQFRVRERPSKLYEITSDREAAKSASNTWLMANQSHGSNQVPVWSGTAAMPHSKMNSYWLTRTTTQSMNEGKMGTTYFWDQQGNLRESRFFVNVGGKRNHGLQLVFPRR